MTLVVLSVGIPGRFRPQLSVRLGDLLIEPSTVFAMSLYLLCLPVVTWRLAKRPTLRSNTRLPAIAMSALVVVWFLGAIRYYGLPGWERVFFAHIVGLAPLSIILVIPNIGLSVSEVTFLARLIMVASAVLGAWSFLVWVAPGYALETVYETVTLVGEMGRAKTPLGGSVLTGAYFPAALPLCMAVYVSEKSRVVKALSLLSGFLLVAGTIATLSRAGFVALIAASSVLASITGWRGVRSFLVIVLVVGVSLVTGVGGLRARYFTFGADADVARMQVQQLAFRVFSEAPVLGAGFGSVFLRQPEHPWQHFMLFDGEYVLIDPHNLYALLLSETGVVGTLCFLMFLASLFLTFRHLRSRSPLTRVRIWSGHMIASLAALIVASFGVTAMVAEQRFPCMAYLILTLPMALSNAFKEAQNSEHWRGHRPASRRRPQINKDPGDARTIGT